MKKIAIILLLLIVVSNQQSCGHLRKSAKTKAKVDSTKLVTSNVVVRLADKDSAATFNFEKWVKTNNSVDLSIDKITRTVTTEPGNLKFVLNVDQLKVSGDSLQATDVATGAKATVYKDKTGNMLFDIKQPGKRQETYEMAGLKLQKKNSTDSGSSTSNSTVLIQSSRDSSHFNKDSTLVKSDVKTVVKEVKKRGGFVKWLGIIVIILAVLRLAIWLLRKQWPWVGWLNRKLGGK